MEMGVCSGHGPEFGPKPKGVLGVLGKFFMLRISGQLPRSRFLDVVLYFIVWAILLWIYNGYFVGSHWHLWLT